MLLSGTFNGPAHRHRGSHFGHTYVAKAVMDQGLRCVRREAALSVDTYLQQAQQVAQG